MDRVTGKVTNIFPCSRLPSLSWVWVITCWIFPNFLAKYLLPQIIWDKKGGQWRENPFVSLDFDKVHWHHSAVGLITCVTNHSALLNCGWEGVWLWIPFKSLQNKATRVCTRQTPQLDECEQFENRWRLGSKVVVLLSCGSISKCCNCIQYTQMCLFWDVNFSH